MGVQPPFAFFFVQSGVLEAREQTLEPWDGWYEGKVWVPVDTSTQPHRSRGPPFSLFVDDSDFGKGEFMRRVDLAVPYVMENIRYWSYINK
jgi:hypothetical protein